MKKRIISILLVLMLCLSLMPVTVLAENSMITKVTITGVAEPVAGAVMNRSFTLESEGTTVAETAGWFNLTDNRWLRDGDTFAAGCEYVFFAYLNHAPGYTRPSDIYRIIVTINGHKGQISANYGEDRITVSYGFECGTENVITNVAISGVTEPVDGEVMNRYFFVETDGVVAARNGAWFNSTEKNWVQDGEVFAAGNTYVFYAYVDVAEGYTWLSDVRSTSVTLNGHKATILPVYGEDYVNIFYSFECAEAPNWYLDSQGCLHLTGAVHNPSTVGDDQVPWKDIRSKIKSIVAEKGSSVDNGTYLFAYCGNLESVDLNELDVSKVQSMENMFSLSAMSTVDLRGWDTSNVTTMKGMFALATLTSSIDLTGWNTEKVTDMSNMFALCSSMRTLKIGTFYPLALEDIADFLLMCNSLSEITVSGFYTYFMGELLLELSPKWTDQATGKTYTTVEQMKTINGIITLSVLPFTDVKVGAWYYDAVRWAVNTDITSGTSLTTFSPNNTCTREQIVTFLWRAAGKPEPTTTSCDFADVKPTDYFYKAVLWAVEEGITVGTSTTTFSPKKDCTRGEIVTFLWRAKGEPKPSNTNHSFTDIKPNAYYYTAVLWAVEKGVTSGTSKTAFSPNKSCTRAEAVAFLYRAFN